ncbi:MAG TPA: type I methionyl aminopeptidase [Actinomycetota bacterium]|nr:type I methionyl aminopeptidase [Actinomycetota bacterium]
MIERKSGEELARMRRAGEIVAATIDRVVAAVAPGVTTAALDRVAAATISEHGAEPSFLGYGGGRGRIPFPATICVSIGDEIVHGIPAEDRVLAEGDVVALDFGAIWEGFHADSAVTVFVGEPPSEDAARLVRETEAALHAAIERVVPGGRLSDIGHAIEARADAAGLGVVREYGGHGIGRKMHEDPFIQNWGAAGRGLELRPGLTIAVEPMLNLGEDDTAVLEDGWTVVTADGSLSAHFEHTLAVTEDGHEILTARG